MATRKVCIAVDPSETSQNALKWAAKSVVGAGDEVKLFTVLHPSPDSELRSGVGAGAAGARMATPGIKPEADPAEEAQGREFLEECKQKIVAEGVKPSQVQADTLVAVANTSADVGRAINEHVDKCGCETIVMGSRGLGLSKKALMTFLGVGSVSDYILKHSSCNVVLYKDKPSA